MKTMKKLLAFLLAAIMLTGAFGTVTFAETEEPLILNYTGVAKVSKTDSNVDQVGTLSELGRLSVTIGDSEWDAAFQYDLSQIPSDRIVKKVVWRSNYSDMTKLLQIKGFETETEMGLYTQSWNTLQTMGYSTPYTIRSQGAAADTEKEQITAIVREADPEQGIAEETTTTNEWVIDMTSAVQNAISSGAKYLSFVVDISAGYSAGYISMWWKPQPRLVIETEPAPKEKTLSLAGSGKFQINNPDSVLEADNWNISTEAGSAGTDSFFQYDLSSLPENEVVTKATWKTLFYNAEGVKRNIEINGFKTTESLGSFKKSYNDLLAAGYNTPYTIRAAATITDAELAYVSATDGASTKEDYPQWNIDMTKAVQDAVAAGDRYFSFVANATSGYCYGYIPYYWTPQPILVVETQKVASVAINGLTDGTITAYNCVDFDIEAEVIEGETAFETVVLSITDENGDVQTYSDPVISGSTYKWCIGGGLSEGTYTAAVTATDTAGETVTATAQIAVEPTVSTVITNSHYWAKSGAGDANFTIEANPSYFQHQLPEIPEGAVVTSAKWYVRTAVMGNGHENGSFILTKLNNEDTELSGYKSSVTDVEGLTAAEAFVTSANVSELLVTKTINGQTDKEFAEVDITEAVKLAYTNDETYFGYMAKLTSGYCTVAHYDSQYRPFIAITYDMDYQEPVEAVEDHSLSVVDGTATASVTVNEGSAVLIVAAYSNGKLLQIATDDTVEDAQLTVTLTNTAEGVSFKSFVWQSVGSMIPLLPAN